MGGSSARELGIDIGVFSPGPLGAITDVEGVLVGHTTLIEGSGPLVPGKGPVRTGVTAILPHGGNLFREKVPAGCFVLNGFGKSTGLAQIAELGTIETPIALTNTLNVGLVADALTAWSCERSPEIGISTGTVNSVVGDINDGFLNDIQGRHVRAVHVDAALAAAAGGPVAQGNVGGGTGCSCLGFKGGIGTSSRRLPARFGGWTLGVLAQTNFGGMLTVNGAPVGRELGVFDFSSQGAGGGSGRGKAVGGGTMAEWTTPEADRDGGARPQAPEATEAPDGSCMVVIATDAPLDARQLTRLCRRGGLGLARTGFYSSNGSGDFFIAFSTARIGSLRDEELSPLFAALVEAVEESVINSLLAAKTMTGRDGNRREALDAETLVRILDYYHARGWASRLPRVE